MEGERGQRVRKGGREREDSVFLLNKQLFLLNFSSLKPVSLFKGEEAQNCLAECIYRLFKGFQGKKGRKSKKQKNLSSALTLHRNAVSILLVGTMSFKAQINSLQFITGALAPIFQRESEYLAVGENARSAALTNIHSCISHPGVGALCLKTRFSFLFQDRCAGSRVN